MATQKLPTRLKNKTWTNQPIKIHKNHQTTDTTQISRTHVFKIRNTTKIICGEKCGSSRVQVIEPLNINILFSHCGSKRHDSASHQM